MDRASVASEQRRLVIRPGRLFDGTGRPAEEDRWVLVEGDRIAAVGKGAPPGDAPTISAPRATLLPGLIDCHVHLSFSGGGDYLNEAKEPAPLLAWRASKHAEQTLQAGFTTVRSLGDLHYVDVHLRAAIDRGLVRGPRVLAAGRIICITGGHGWPLGGREADGPDDVRRAVREQVKAGADLIKFTATGGVMTPGVNPQAASFTLEELRAGVEEAHKLGRKTAAHAQGSDGIRNALLAGIDSIEHGFWLTDELVDLMLERGTFYSATLVAGRMIAEHGTAGGIPEFAVQKARWAGEAHRKSFRLAVERGVNLVLGTDAGTPFNFHGRNAIELALMVEGGLEPRRALHAATGAAARLLGLEAEIGTIAEGKQADLVLVQGDPTEEVAVLQDPARIGGVWKGGVAVVLAEELGR